MKFSAAVFAAMAVSVGAFTPGSSKGFAQAPSGLMIPEQLKNKDGSLWTPTNMVAGGAERAVGQDYYEGA